MIHWRGSTVLHITVAPPGGAALSQPTVSVACTVHGTGASASMWTGVCGGEAQPRGKERLKLPKFKEMHSLLPHFLLCFGEGHHLVGVSETFDEKIIPQSDRHKYVQLCVHDNRYPINYEHREKRCYSDKWKHGGVDTRDVRGAGWDSIHKTIDALHAEHPGGVPIAWAQAVYVLRKCPPFMRHMSLFFFLQL